MFGKIKQMLGIGGVKVLCTTPMTTFVQTGSKISGTATLSSKSDQQISRVVARVIELHHHKHGNETKTKEYELGTTVVANEIAIKAGETQNLQFEVAYTGGQTMGDKIAAQGGVLGGMAKIGSFAKGSKSEYQLRVDVHVKGTMLPSHNEVKLIPG